jgi:Rad3-related DNA helicase
LIRGGERCLLHWLSSRVALSLVLAFLASRIPFDAPGQAHLLPNDPDPEKTFSELYSDSMPDWLLEKRVTPMVVYIPRALDCMFHDEPNFSMVVQAQTGSGKTLTYLLALLS